MVAPSTFRTALPYAAITLGTGIAGAVLSITASSTAVAVAGVAVALFGAYAFYGVVSCGLLHRDDPKAFQDNVGKHVATAFGFALTNIITTVAETVLSNMINNWLNGRRSRA